MPTSGISANVNVTGEAPMTSTSSSAVTSSTTTNDFPLENRKIQSLLVLAPGITEIGNNPIGTTASGQRSSSGQRSNTFLIDGANANVTLPSGEQSPGSGASGAAPLQGGGTDNLLSSQSTSEITITTRSFGAEYGSSTGAIFSVITKSGTNEFHGSLFEYFGNDVLDANDWFANSLGIKRPPHRQNDYGGTLGGPIKRDTCFLFLFV